MANTQIAASNKENASESPVRETSRLFLRLRQLQWRPNTDNAENETACGPVTLPASAITSETQSGDVRATKKRATCKSTVDTPTKRKRAASTPPVDSADDTDSELELWPKRDPKMPQADFKSKANARTSKKPKTKASKANTKTSISKDIYDTDSEIETPKPSLSVINPATNRNKRIFNPSDPIHASLIAAATKAGPEYYDSDASSEPGDVKSTTKPHLFRNVRWGSFATSYDDDANFSREPDFTQFVPGRFEVRPDGSVSDQKAKLVIKLLDHNGDKRIFANPPPRDWASQAAISTLNKRSVQQIRRHTHVRFREVVTPYVEEERAWILANLTAGKPTKGWKAFVGEFNKRFEGKVVKGVQGERPARTHSSLTKEVERFGPKFYALGEVPFLAKKEKKA